MTMTSYLFCTALVLLDFSYGDKAVFAAFFDFGNRDIQLSCENFHNSRRAEAALTSAHTRSYAALDGVDGGSRDGSVYSFDDFALGDFFTAANDSAVS